MGDRDSQYEAWAQAIEQYQSKGNNVSINQAIVSSNIRGLQSRAHKRGITLAALESRRTAVKTAIKALRNIGYPVDPALLDNRDLMNQMVKSQADSQKLDRQLLKQQYVLQGLGRPAKASKEPFKIGDVVVVVDPKRSDYWAYKTGTRAKLVGRDGADAWLANFNDQGNPPGSFEADDGNWYVDESEIKKV